MNRPSSRPPSRQLAAQDGRISRDEEDALTVAMIVAPGVYARNRMYDFFTLPNVQRARVRAGLIRGLVAQLGRAGSVSLTAHHGESAFTLRYGIAALHMSRTVELSALELSALRMMLERANVSVLPPSPADKEIVNRCLSRLMDEAD